jgi:hypothetical protein
MSSSRHLRCYRRGQFGERADVEVDEAPQLRGIRFRYRSTGTHAGAVDQELEFHSRLFYGSEQAGNRSRFCEVEWDRQHGDAVVRAPDLTGQLLELLLVPRDEHQVRSALREPVSDGRPDAA